MINLARDIYWGKEAAEHKRKMIRKLRTGKPQIGTYVISLAASPQDLLDIIPSWMLYRPRKEPLTVIGIAASRPEAYEVCRDIVLDTFRCTGGYDVREYVTSRFSGAYLP